MPQPKTYDADPEINTDTVSEYLKTRGYSDDLARRMADTVVFTPYSGANYDHIKGTRKWLDSQKQPASVPQTDVQRGYDTQNRLSAADALSRNPNSAPVASTLLGMNDAMTRPSTPRQPAPAAQVVSVMTTDGVKQVPAPVAQWLIQQGHATPLGQAQKQPGAYMQQALPMATAMASKWGIPPDKASEITTALLAQSKDTERNPFSRAASDIGGAFSSAWGAMTGDD